MQIKQWEDKNLAQYSYAILDESVNKVVLVDPSRNPQPYLDFARNNNSSIVGIFETHPHADFISGHLELHRLTGATIYAHSFVGAEYPSEAFDDGYSLELGNTRLISMHTPGHSPDSISILVEENGKQKAVFSGDTLFIGDCGRPDLRESAGNIHSTRQDLARKMYHTLRNKFMTLDNDVVVYPAHGSGTLCGKNLSKESSGTIGSEKKYNWSLQEATEDEFVKNLLLDQPFIPVYFPHDVEINRKGAADLKTAINSVKMESADPATRLNTNLWVVDVRDEKEYKKGHFPNSINLMETGKFETWLGTIIQPGEKFYLAGESKDQLLRAIERVASIGYENQIEKSLVFTQGNIQDPELDLTTFNKNQNAYTILDVRDPSERKEQIPFKGSISIPLPLLRKKINEIPKDKPIVVHCAGGYRSAAASSMIKSSLNGTAVVYDMGETIREYL